MKNKSSKQYLRFFANQSSNVYISSKVSEWESERGRYEKQKSAKRRSNVFGRYLGHGRNLGHSQTLFFTFSPRRRQRRRQQYEVFQKIFYETSLSNTKMSLSITSDRNNRTFQFIDTRHSTFTFCFVFISFWSQWRSSLIYEIRIRSKLEKLLISNVFDRWSHLINFF
jgi:hypothetical protein